MDNTQLPLKLYVYDLTNVGAVKFTGICSMLGLYQSQD